jgi:ferrochelatase
MAESGKIAVVLLNLGGPAREADIQPFLFNFFMDEHVVTLPKPLRWLLASWISWSRGRSVSKKIYALIGGKSPLLENTQAQAKVLERALRKNAGDEDEQETVKTPAVKTFVCMRHWHPRADEVVKEVAAFNPEKIILLPLYPQYSTATTLSAFEDWQAAAGRAGVQIPTKTICCYPADRGFIAASAALLSAELKKAPRKIRVLFSAHGLPERIVRAGDPYQAQCELTAAAIVKELNLADWQICYQSRVGRLKWIEPSLEDALEKAADDKVGVIIYPLSFVSEHVETLVELDIEFRHRADAMGIAPYIRVPTVSTHPLFIAGLRDLVLSCISGTDCGKCPKPFAKCWKKNG